LPQNTTRENPQKSAIVRLELFGLVANLWQKLIAG
jgi:hypothetical protein